MEPKNQRYNPTEDQARRQASIQEVRERLANYKELEEKVNEARSQREAIAEAKAKLTDVKRAQVSKYNQETRPTRQLAGRCKLPIRLELFHAHV